MGRSLFITFASLFLIAAIPVSVYLVSQQQILTSQAFNSEQQPTVGFSGSNVVDLRATSPEVTLNIFYPSSALTPTDFRVANSIPDLESAAVNPFSGNEIDFPWVLNSQVGSQTVYVQFRINQQWQTPLTASIILE